MKYLVLVTLLMVGCSSKDKLAIIPVPAEHGSAEPFLFTDENGQVYLSWVQSNDSTSSLVYARLQEGRWTAPTRIASGANWFVNWADYPMLAVHNQNYVAHFLDKSGDDTFAYDVKVVTSADGNTWRTPFVIHSDGQQAEHGFVSLLPYGDNFLIVWLDGRNTVMEGMEHEVHHGGHHGVMTLRAAVIDPTGKKIKEWELDDKTCDCCQTTAVLTGNGPVVVYRDRTDDEQRDMAVVRLQPDSVWTQPAFVHRDNWNIEGCPVNGPRAAALGNSLVVAWFTAADNQPKVKISFSKDGGETFDPPIQVNTGETIGRVDVVMLDATAAVVSWIEEEQIKAMRVNKDGRTGSPVTVTTISEARSSGFPQMTKTGESVVFAWTDDRQTIQTAVMDVHAF